LPSLLEEKKRYFYKLIFFKRFILFYFLQNVHKLKQLMIVVDHIQLNLIQDYVVDVVVDPQFQSELGKGKG
jgi:hypothetical protein